MFETSGASVAKVLGTDDPATSTDTAVSQLMTFIQLNGLLGCHRGEIRAPRANSASYAIRQLGQPFSGIVPAARNGNVTKNCCLCATSTRTKGHWAHGLEQQSSRQDAASAEHYVCDGWPSVSPFVILGLSAFSREGDERLFVCGDQHVRAGNHAVERIRLELDLALRKKQVSCACDRGCTRDRCIATHAIYTSPTGDGYPLRPVAVGMGAPSRRYCTYK